MITISQEILSNALNAVTRASQKSSLITAFALVRLDASADGELSLSCFNGDTAARAIVFAACNDDLSVCVDAQTLKAVTDTLVGEIQISVTDKSVILKNGAHCTTLRIVEETIPIIGGEATTELLTIPGATLRSLARVIPFASTDDARPALQVQHLVFSEQSVTAQAADGFTAAIITESVTDVKKRASVSLPLNFARLLAALVDDHDMVKVQAVGDNRFLFEITNAERSKYLTLATVTPANGFPAEQIAQLLQGAQSSALTNLRVQKFSLAQTVKMVGAMGTQNTFLKVVNGVIKVASAVTDTGQARNIIDGSVSGQDTKVWLSAAFLKRAVEACKAEIAIQLGGDKQPVLFLEGSFTAILMPLSVENGQDPFGDDEEPLAIALPQMAVAA